MKKTIFFCTLSFLFLFSCCAPVFGQKPMSKELASIVEEGSELELFNIKSGIHITTEEFIQHDLSMLQLAPNSSMQRIRVEHDELGFTHSRYQQFVNNYKVMGAEMIIHEKDGRVHYVNGMYMQSPLQHPNQIIDENEGLQLALKQIRSTDYLWLDKEAEAAYRKTKKDSSASLYPKGQLVYIPKPGRAIGKEEYALCWTYSISVNPATESYEVCIDASTGETVNKFPLTLSCITGTCTTLWNGNRSIYTFPLPPLGYMLQNFCNTSTIHIVNGNGNDNGSGATEYIDGDNIWPSTALGKYVGQTHFSVQQTRNYFATVHAREGYDDNGHAYTSYLNPGYIGNAFYRYNTEATSFGGTATGGNPFITLDVAGHEHTHGMVHFTSDLTYSGESGALNESFADCLGEAVEAFTLGTPDWVLAGELDTLRSFVNPNSKGQPDTYLGSNWFPQGSCVPLETNDFCGVHTNSGVQNYWFYLLSVGGGGTNDLGLPYCVEGIGINKARKIAYRAMINLTSGSGYSNARLVSIQAAKDEFGVNSNEALQTANAWCAVGVGPAQNIPPNPSITISTSNNNYCSGTVGFVTFTATVTNATSPSYQWVVNGVNIVGNNYNTFTTFALNNYDQIKCILTFTPSCPYATSSTLSSNTITMNIYSVNASEIYTTINPSEICEGTTVNLTANSVFCQPNYNFGTTNGHFISHVKISNYSGNTATTFDHVSAASSAPYYSSYPASGNTTTTLTANNEYRLLLTGGSNTTSSYRRAWIDYNHDSVFSANEKVTTYDENGSFPLINGYFEVPYNAVNGPTRLRVREVYNVSNPTACDIYNYGETKDYWINITGGVNSANPITFSWSGVTNPTVGNIVSATPQYTQQYTVTATDIHGCAAVTKTNPVIVHSINLQTSSSSSVICPNASVNLQVTSISSYCEPVGAGTGSGNYISSVKIYDIGNDPLNPILNNSSGASSSSPFLTIFQNATTLLVGNFYQIFVSTGSANNNVIGVFLDYDHNGIFNMGMEKLGEISLAANSTGGIYFTIPSWAYNGNTRLRVRLATSNGVTPCTSWGLGESEDYTVTLVGGVTPLNTIYDWQPSSTIAGSGNSVSASPTSSTTYTVVATDGVGCTGSANVSVLVENPPSYILNQPSPLWICAGDTTALSIIPSTISYCEPTYSTGTSQGDFISQVSITQIVNTIFNSSSGASANPYYTLYPESGSTTTTLTAGNTYYIWMSCGSSGSNSNIAAWIDYDGNGEFFGPLEKIAETGNLNGPYSGVSITFKVPLWAQNGKVRLRVREASGILDLDPCVNYTYGETEDYDITITGGVAPITYQWSPLGISTTSSIVYDTPAYTQTYTLTATNGYGCTQAPATITAYVNSPTVMATATSSTLCLGGSTTLSANNTYCLPNYTNGNMSGDYLQTVSIDGTSMYNTSGVNSTVYTLYNASGNTTTTLTAGNTYTLTVTVGSRIAGNTFAAWMDFDGNKELNNGFEKLGEVYNLNANTTASIVFTIPAWAIDGETRLRVRETFFTPSITSCGTNMDGECEDYPITITGGLYAPPPTMVWNDPLNTNGPTLTVSPTYSTQYNVTATDVNGCSKTSTVDIQVNAMAPLTSSASSNSICAGNSVTLNAASSASSYCAASGAAYYSCINSVSIPGTSLNNITGYVSSAGYTLFPQSGSTTAILQASSSYNLDIGFGYGTPNSYVVWIDFNQNNIFEEGREKIASQVNLSSYTHTTTFSVPSWAKNGTTRMRVIQVSTNSFPISSCFNYPPGAYGEVEDYDITITNGINTLPIVYTWSPATTPTTGNTVSASPISTTTYTVTASDQFGCTATSTQTISMTTPASFFTNTYGQCVDSTYTFYASPLTCSGNAFLGNGSSYGASLANSWALTQTSNFTMEAWVRWNGATGSNQIIYYNGNTSSNGYGIMVNAANANKLAILLAGSTTLNTTVALTVGVWQHIVVKRSPTLSGGFWTLYVDGVSYNPTPNLGTPASPSSGGTYVGRGTTGNYFNGAIDEIRVWNFMLSNTQINANRVSCISTPASGLVGYWKFNEAIGGVTSCLDQSGGNRTLTLSNVNARTVSASYAWNYGDGATGTGISSSHQYTTTGYKNVVLSVTDITGCVGNDVQNIHINACYKTLSLKLFLQGYYVGGQQMNSTLMNQGMNNTAQETDSLVVELHDATYPFNLIATHKGILQTNGNLNCDFPNVPSGLMAFYVVVKHRNSIETWSTNAIMFNNLNQAMYDFSDAASKAYGDNQVEVEPGVWALYCGDINQDMSVDAFDYLLLDPDIVNGAFGYFTTDLNGDGSVDAFDYLLLDPNIVNGIGASTP